MSLYRGYHSPLSELHAEKVAAKPDDAVPVPRAAPDAHLHRLRRAQPSLALLNLTKAWIAALPEAARPHALATQFARVANSVCAVWNDPTAGRQYLADLFSDHRGHRQGFPLDVMHDIESLLAYHDEVHRPPGVNSVWARSLSDGTDR